MSKLIDKKDIITLIKDAYLINKPGADKTKFIYNKVAGFIEKTPDRSGRRKLIRDAGQEYEDKRANEVAVTVAAAADTKAVVRDAYLNPDADTISQPSAAATLLRYLAKKKRIDRNKRGANSLEPISDVFKQWPTDLADALPFNQEICYLSLVMSNSFGCRPKYMDLGGKKDNKVKWRTPDNFDLLLAGLRQATEKRYELLSEAAIVRLGELLTGNCLIDMIDPKASNETVTVEHVGPVASKFPSAIGSITGVIPPESPLSAAMRRFIISEYKVANVGPNCAKTNTLIHTLRGGSANMWPVFPNTAAISTLVDRVAIFTRGTSGSTVRIRCRDRAEQRFANSVQALIHLCAIANASLNRTDYPTEHARSRALWREQAIRSVTDVAAEHCNAIRHLETTVEAVDLMPYGGNVMPPGTRLTDILVFLSGAAYGSITDAQIDANPLTYYNALSPDRKAFFKSIKGKLFTNYNTVLETGKLPDLKARMEAAAASPETWPTAAEVNEGTAGAEIVDLLYNGPPEAGGVAPPAELPNTLRVVAVIKRVNSALENAEGELKELEPIAEESEESAGEGEEAAISAETIAEYKRVNALRAADSGATLSKSVKRPTYKVGNVISNTASSIATNAAKTRRITKMQNKTNARRADAVAKRRAVIAPSAALGAPPPGDFVAQVAVEGPPERRGARGDSLNEELGEIGGGNRSKTSRYSKRNGTKQSKRMGRILSRKLTRLHLHRSHRKPRPSSTTAQRYTQRRGKSNK